MNINDRSGTGGWVMYSTGGRFGLWNGADRFTCDGSGNLSAATITLSTGAKANTVLAGNGSGFGFWTDTPTLAYITVTGPYAIVGITDRGGALGWGLYSTSSIFRLNNGSADVFTCDTSGNVAHSGAVTALSYKVGSYAGGTLVGQTVLYAASLSTATVYLRTVSGDLQWYTTGTGVWQSVGAGGIGLLNYASLSTSGVVLNFRSGLYTAS
jgi:hypothetical protein